MIRKFSLLLLLTPLLPAGAALNCPAGMPIGAVELKVARPGGDAPLPLRTMTRLEKGDRVLYAPVLRGKEKRHGKVTFVLVPVDKPGTENMLVLEPKSADKPAQWTVPFRVSLAVYAYGPDGLSTGKVKNFLGKDEELIGQLADYAEKTAQTEGVLQALTVLNQGGASENLNAALQGFAGQYGMSNQIDRSASSNEQTLAILRTLNPALSTYDPISPERPQRLSQTAGLATTVAGMFFGSTVGLAAGGTAMALNLKSLFFPNAVFRSSYAQPLSGAGMALCGSRDAVDGRSKLAYVWAMRVPDAMPPEISLDRPAYLPAGLKSSLEANAPDARWKVLNRARNWVMKDAQGKAAAVTVTPLPDKHALLIDLSRTALAPGKYELSGMWDWDPFTVKGEINVLPLSTFEHARLAPASQMRLLRHSGKQIVDLEGDDFEFVNKVEIVKKGDKYGKPASVPFSLPKGLRRGPQERLEMEIDTSGLDTGVYQVLLTQLDGNAKPVEVRVLEEPPAIAGLPLVANTGETRQVVALRGKGLGRITGIEATGAGIELEATAATGDARTMQVRLNPDARQGSKLDLRVQVRDYPEPLVLRGALEVAGPRPRILEARLAPPSGLEIALRPKEIPAGVYADVMMRTRGLSPDSRVEIGCKGGASAPFQARIGESAGGLRTQRTGNDSLFLSFDPASLPADCTASATVDNGREGASDPFDLGRVIRIPHIQSFVLTSEVAGDNAYVGVLTGHDLELIEKTGWDAANGLPVLGLPTTTTGEGRTQSLKIRLPWPSPAPHSPLYIWLRGEPQGRATTVKY